MKMTKKVKMDIKIVRNGHENSSNEQKNSSNEHKNSLNTQKKYFKWTIKIVQMDKK